MVKVTKKYAGHCFVESHALQPSNEKKAHIACPRTCKGKLPVVALFDLQYRLLQASKPSNEYVL